jgi:hypothetical protein
MRRNNPNHIVFADSYRPHCGNHSYEVYALLGLAPKAKLPPEGMPERLIQGIPVWVDPLPEVKLNRYGRPQRRFALRVRARCPQCGKETALSRLIQHTCK